jgi:hypothetical protein
LNGKLILKPGVNARALLVETWKEDAALPIAGLTSNFSPIPRIAPPPLGIIIDGGDFHTPGVAEESSPPVGFCPCDDRLSKLISSELRKSRQSNIHVL